MTPVGAFFINLTVWLGVCFAAAAILRYTPYRIVIACLIVFAGVAMLIVLNNTAFADPIFDGAKAWSATVGVFIGVLIAVFINRRLARTRSAG